MDDIVVYFLIVIALVVLVWVSVDYLNKAAKRQDQESDTVANYTPLKASFESYPPSLWMTSNLNDFSVLLASPYRYRIVNNSGSIIFDNRIAVRADGPVTTCPSLVKEDRLQHYFEVWKSAADGYGEAYRDKTVSIAVRVGGKGDSRIVHVSGPNAV